ncbi:hypothetical protein P3S68_019513 [Capsicum galapagoense]
MANSKYEYVKCFEVEDEVMYPNIIVVQIDGRDFGSFSEKHGFEKPNDEKSLNLMNACAIKVLESFSDIIFAYGFSDEYSFVLKKETTFYQRRASKILSIIVSFFSSTYVTKWKEFSQKELSVPPSFHSRVINCASMEVLQAYLLWRQTECHISNQYNTCLWKLVFSGKSEKEAKEILKSGFCEDNGFQKPNDEQALKLMNSCAVSLLEMFKDIIFAYGVSDEYSFVLKKDSLLYQRWSSKIVSAIVSLFSSMYVMKWKEFFPEEFKEPPYFDGRSVCCPSSEILRDYLSWRQVDCHINNQYNTCFWLLVKSGKSKTEAQSSLKGTQTQEKNELLAKFGITNYVSDGVFFFLGQNDEPTGNDRVVVEHCNIIETSFWKEHPRILLEEEPLLMILRPHGNKMLRLS